MPEAQAGAAGAGQTEGGIEDPSALPFEEDCFVLPAAIEEDRVLEKRNVRPGAPDYCVEPFRALRVEATLVIEPGVMIEVQQRSAIAVQNGGSLTARGTADRPIVFTGRSDGPGAWPGIHFLTASSENVLEHVIVEHAGGDTVFEPTSVAVGASTGASGSVAISNTVLRDGGGIGIVVYNGLLPGFVHNTITGHAAAPFVGTLPAAGQLDATSSFTGNAQSFIGITASTSVNVKIPSTDVTLAALGLPYRVGHHGIASGSQLELRSKLTVLPGVRLEFEQSAGVVVEQTGSLEAVGTRESPIVFDAANESSGGWRGMGVISTSKYNRLEFVEVRNGGSPNRLCCGFNKSANIVIGDIVDVPGTISLRDVTIAGSAGYGIYIHKSGRLSSERVRFESNEREDLAP
jgi:hypothetical protein